MVKDELIRAQLGAVLGATAFDSLGKRYEGKVRDVYDAGTHRYLITSDRISCFDVVLGTVPFKGQVLNQLAAFWFAKTEAVVENHVLDVPDPNMMVVRSCEILPIEVVVRGYLAGSAWRDYEKGDKVSGIAFPRGMRMSQRLETPVLTPSTKEAKGAHDLPISEAEIVERGIVAESIWHQVRELALELFRVGTEEAAKRDLLLVDTKYEFGLHKGKVILCDEIHTLDSSRYWVCTSYQQRFEAGEAPEMLDKETVRQWLISLGFMGHGTPPPLTDEKRVEIARHYINSYERITGETFNPVAGDAVKRIQGKLPELTARPW